MSLHRQAGTRVGTPLSRRQFLHRGAVAGAALAAFGGLGVRSARAASGGTVVVRTPGGSVEDTYRKAIWEPFTAATGIQVENYTANAAKVEAMIQSGRIGLDVLDIAESLALLLQHRGSLAPLPASTFRLTDAHDLQIMTDRYAGEYTYSAVIGYNTNAFPTKPPSSYADVWNVADFHGPRTLEDLSVDVGVLEGALLADGAPTSKLYPLDVDRAFRKLREIRKDVVKFWTSAAVPAEMLTNKDAVIGTIPANRAIVLQKAGAPVGFTWNQAAIESQVLCVLKGAPNLENAYKYIDFALQPKQQAAIAQMAGFGPLNRKAFNYLTPAQTRDLPTSPLHLREGFFINMQWWFDNRPEVLKRWQSFMLGG
ncbi:MAG TPA: ABC transporter substrate-binding protein [bacterium]|nr:ABC transporter substrate-binding protein [bacterium]